MGYSIPILIIIFNRPAETSVVFDIIRSLKPSQLFVAADGPRINNKSDEEKCRKAREIIKVDWECTLHTLFRNENKGCGLGPAEAICWFFENVEAGIILEDDIVPGPGFFEFMEFALTNFIDDKAVNMVTGLNLAQKWNLSAHPYLFSRFGGTAGWGTWKRVWKNFEYSLEIKDESKSPFQKLKKSIKSKKYYIYFSNLFDKTLAESKTDYWDYQWLYTRLIDGGYSIVPRENLVINIGFGLDASHTKIADHPQALIKHGWMDFPLKPIHPKESHLYDWYIFERFFNPQKRSFIKKIILKLIKITFTR